VTWYATSTDVHDLKEAALGRARTDEGLTAILDGIGEPLFTLDDGLVITHVNTAAERAFGRRREDVKGQRFSDAFPEAAASALERELDASVRDRVTRTFRADLGRGGRAGRYDVRLHPHATGLAIFLRPCEGGDR
jgi:PAS domain S-box-containing protein